MNTDSSQMLYPDFTHNMGAMGPAMAMGPIDNSDYYDIAEIKARV